MVKSGIYLILSRIDDRIYVGSSSNVSRRISVHKYDLKKGIHANQRLQRFSNKYGMDKLEFCFILRCDVKDLIRTEQNYMDVLNPWFNICRIAASVRGVKKSNEQVERMRQRALGKKNPAVSESNRRRRGKKQTQETKIKIGNKNRGRKRPDVSDRNKGNIGKVFSEEHKRKISATSTGRLFPNRTIYLEIDGATKSMAEWAASVGLHPTAIRYRLSKGMTAKEAVFSPKKNYQWLGKIE